MQAKMKFFADQNRADRDFEIRDKVYMRLLSYCQMSVAMQRNLKLSHRYYGLYEVLQKVGKVAYRLDLPDHS